MTRPLASLSLASLLAACGVAHQGPAVTTGREALRSQGGSSCASSSDCTGILPMFCLICADGSNGCAHWGCVSGQCQTVTCDAPAAPTCAAESDCAYGESCQGGSCAACHTVCNMDCVQGKSCQSDANGCVSCQASAPPPAPTCAQEADCAYGQNCQNGACTACPSACSMACVQGQSCQSDANGCASCQESAPPAAPTCAQEADCAYGQSCQNGACTACPGFCNMDCMQGQSCQSDLNGCMGCQPVAPTPCAQETDCAYGQSCQSGACTACPAACGMACAQGSSCQPDVNGCMGCQPVAAPPCYSDWDCSWWQSCEGGQCQ